MAMILPIRRRFISHGAVCLMYVCLYVSSLCLSGKNPNLEENCSHMAAYSHSYPLTLIIFSLIFVLGHISSDASSESSSSFGSEFQPLLPSEIEALGLGINSDDNILQEESLSIIPSNHIIDGDEFDDIHDDNIDSHLADNDNRDQLHNHTTPDLLIPFDESDVIVLAAANFSNFIAQNYFSMVMFYAPWCGHCKALGPHYAAAASELKRFDPGNRSVSLAKVDSTQNPDLAIQFDVEEYPTIFFFVDGMPKLYSHNLTRYEINNGLLFFAVYVTLTFSGKKV